MLRTTRPFVRPSRRSRDQADAVFAPERLEARQLMATMAWDGDAADGDFTNPLNWEGDVLPGRSDSAVVHPTFGPTIAVKAGQSIELDSLDLDWPMQVLGELAVYGGTRIGPEQFDVAVGGVAYTADLELWSSQTRPSGGVTNRGTWTIAGTSLLQVSITSFGVLEFGAGSRTSLYDYVSHETVRIDSLGGVLEIGERAWMYGVSGGHEVYVNTEFTVGAGALMDGCRIEVRGGAERAVVEFLPGLAGRAIMVGGGLTMGQALVEGKLDTAGAGITFEEGCIFNADLRAEGGVLTALASVATQPGSRGRLDISGGNVRLGADNQTGTVTLDMPGRIAGWGGVYAAQPSVLELFTIVRCEISGPGPLEVGVLDGVIINASAEVRVLEAIRKEQAVIPGWPLAAQVRGTLVVGDRVEWRSGQIALAFEDSELIIEEGGRLLALDAGPSDRTITGVGAVRNFGEISFQLASGGYATISALLDNTGRVSITGGTLLLDREIVQLGSEGVLEGGEWRVGAGGDLVFGVRPMLRNLATILIGSGGSTDVLASMTHNEGVIEFFGKNVWDDGDDGAISIVNRGTIRKVGKGALTIVGDIAHRAIATLEARAGRLRLETAQFRNPGTIILGEAGTDLAQRKARLEISGGFEQTSTGALDVLGGRGDTLQTLPRMIVGGRMELAGSLEASAFGRSFATEPTESVWLLAAGRSRVGEFDRVDFRIKRSTEAMLYTGKLAQVVVTR